MHRASAFSFNGRRFEESKVYNPECLAIFQSLREGENGLKGWEQGAREALRWILKRRVREDSPNSFRDRTSIERETVRAKRKLDERKRRRRTRRSRRMRAVLKFARHAQSMRGKYKEGTTSQSLKGVRECSACVRGHGCLGPVSVDNNRRPEFVTRRWFNTQW